MSVYPIFLVLGSDGTIGAYAREDILKDDLVQNLRIGKPARAVYKLAQTMNVSYERDHSYDEWTAKTMDEELLNNDISLAKGVTQLATAVNQSVTILARAILELEDPEGKHFLSHNTHKALQALAETETTEQMIDATSHSC